MSGLVMTVSFAEIPHVWILGLGLLRYGVYLGLEG